MNPLEKIMAGMMDSDAPTNPPTPPDVLAHTLLEIFARFRAGNPFKPGDLVTPRNGYGYKDPGPPNVVLAIFEPVKQPPVSPGASVTWADMRIACEHDGDIVTFVVESFCFEPWLGEVADIGGPSL